MGKIEFDNQNPIISVWVKIVHRGEVSRVKMALDTGASISMIPWKVAAVLELHPELSKEKIDITTASGVITVPLVTLDSMAVSHNEVINVSTLVHNLPPKSFVDGLLGASFLNKFELCINYMQGYFEFKK